MRSILFITLGLLTSLVQLPACTSAVISGKATADGRSLLWKHRDTSYEANKLVYGEGSRFDYVGIANTVDTLSREIWMGSNTAGFAIMNTASYNLNEGQTCDVPDDQEGLFMRAALEVCGSLTDFEAFMDSTQGSWGLAANFGVIDAAGGAAYYEKGYYNYTKYDVTDPRVAPDGYLVRTNFSVSGTADEGYGFIRYDATAALFESQDAISVEFILDQATRNFHHALQDIDLRDNDRPRDLLDTTYVLYQDFVVRRSSVSTIVIQGVLPGEDPGLTTLWTVLGWQPVTLVTPVWVRSAELLPAITRSINGTPAPINAAGLELKARCFPLQRGNGQDYLLHSTLTNQANTGILDQVLDAEPEIISRTLDLQDKWRRKRYRDRDLRKYNQWLQEYITSFYSEKLDIDLHPTP